MHLRAVAWLYRGQKSRRILAFDLREPRRRGPSDAEEKNSSNRVLLEAHNATQVLSQPRNDDVQRR